MSLNLFDKKHRKGHSFGNVPLIDALAYDGLTDAYHNISMGLCAEKTASESWSTHFTTKLSTNERNIGE